MTTVYQITAIIQFTDVCSFSNTFKFSSISIIYKIMSEPENLQTEHTFESAPVKPDTQQESIPQKDQTPAVSTEANTANQTGQTIEGNSEVAKLKQQNLDLKTQIESKNKELQEKNKTIQELKSSSIVQGKKIETLTSEVQKIQKMLESLKKSSNPQSKAQAFPATPDSKRESQNVGSQQQSKDSLPKNASWKNQSLQSQLMKCQTLEDVLRLSRYQPIQK